MRHIRNLAYFVLGLMLSAVVMLPYARAQQPTSYAGMDHINRIIRGTPGVVTVGVSNGVNATATGLVNVSANQLKINVPTKVVATIPKSTIAKVAAKAARIGTVVGVAWLAYDVYNAIKNSGVRVCSANEGFFCKLSDEPDKMQTGWVGVGTCSTVAAQCTFDQAANAVVLSVFGASATLSRTEATSNSNVYWVYALYNRETRAASTITYKGTGSPKPGSEVPLTEPELELTLQQKFDADYNKTKQMYDALRADQKKLGLTDQELVPATSPVTVEVTPTTTPETITSTTTITNPDGTTSTITTRQTTTVTGTQTGTTVGDTTINYNPQTTTTTTTTNNNTNQTTTTTTVENHPSSQPTSDLQIPDDYNREATQQQILEEMKKQDCAEHPTRAGCSEFDTPPEVEEIPRQNVPFVFSPVSFSSGAACPSPIPYSLGPFGNGELSFEPICDYAIAMRPIFLLIGACTSFFIIVYGVSKL